MKTPMTPSGIKHAAFRLEAQCLSQLRHRVPRIDKKAHIILRGTGISQMEYKTSRNEDLEIYMTGIWTATPTAEWYTETVSYTLHLRMII
jgi:hypothetical protein